MRPTLALTIGVALLTSLVSASPVTPSSAESPSIQLERDLSAVAVQPLQSRSGFEKRKRHTVKATWYGGGQLNNPACGGPTPKNHDLVAAVSSHGHFKCGDKIKLTKNGKSVTVKVVDMCASCGPHHIDLSIGSFEKLGAKEQGVIHHIGYAIQ